MRFSAMVSPMVRPKRADRKAGIEVASSVFVDRGGRGLAGHGRVALLERIDALGSISGAARELGMSYRAAWDAIESMDNVAGEPLVERAPGGKGGGGTRLTDAGRNLIRIFRQAEAAHARLTAELAARFAEPERYLQLARAIAFRSSARNQFVATVASLPDDEGITVVTLDLGERAELQVAVTREAVDALGLAQGSAVLALIKASAVHVRAPHPGEAGHEPVNVLRGTVYSRSDKGTVPQFRVAVTRRLTVWGVGEPGSRLQPGNPAECVVAWSVPLLVLPSA